MQPILSPGPQRATKPEMPLISIINGDCLEITKGMPDGSVDLVLTDPPYNLGKDYGSYSSDARDPKDYWNWFKLVFRQVYRVMRSGYLYLSHSDKGVYQAKPLLEDLGFIYLQTIIWHGMNGHNRWKVSSCWSYRHEPILFMKKGQPPPLDTGPGVWYTSVIPAPRPQSNYKAGRFHPTQKPLKLYTTLLARTPCSHVLDPFLGSGTSAIASRVLGRDFTGIDINPEYCEIARKRISQELLF
ncbi:Modification methylase DpnIIB [subsurface metagenome]